MRSCFISRSLVEALSSVTLTRSSFCFFLGVRRKAEEKRFVVFLFFPSLSAEIDTTPLTCLSLEERSLFHLAMLTDLVSQCEICGAPASYINFGVKSCSSCKMFFKRNAEAKDVRCFFFSSVDLLSIVNIETLSVRSRRPLRSDDLQSSHVFVMSLGEMFCCWYANSPDSWFAFEEERNETTSE